MTEPIQPIYLLADSQLLFWKNDGEGLLSEVKHRLGTSNPAAAYVGASNGDDPSFYSIFTAAMSGVGITDCRMIMSSFSDEDRAFLEAADIILLAGGDARRGWEIIERVGIKEVLVSRYLGGGALMGVSAGAIQLGLYGFQEGDDPCVSLFDALKLVPFVLDAHQERSDWERLKTVVRMLESGERGLGIPAGGGFIYHPDHTIEPVRFPMHEFSVVDKEVTDTLLFPANSNPRVPEDREKETSD